MKSTAAVTTIAIDLAKNVFQLALADASFRIVRSLRLKRTDFLSFWPNHPVVNVVMDACGGSRATSGRRGSMIAITHLESPCNPLKRNSQSVIRQKQLQQRQVHRSGQTSIS